MLTFQSIPTAKNKYAPKPIGWICDDIDKFNDHIIESLINEANTKVNGNNELPTFTQAIAQAALHHGHVPRRMNPPDSGFLVQNLRNLESGRNLLPQGPGRQQTTKDISKARRQLLRSRASAQVRKAANSGAVNACHRSSPSRIPEKLLCTEGKGTWATEATDPFSGIFIDESQERAEWSSRVGHQLSDHTFDVHITAEEVKQSILSLSPGNLVQLTISYGRCYMP